VTVSHRSSLGAGAPASVVVTFGCVSVIFVSFVCDRLACGLQTQCLGGSVASFAGEGGQQPP
jgi:hypothetical protein